MAEVRPFRGLIYNPKVIENLEDVISPPFDTISRELYRELLSRHPYNIVRLEFPIGGQDKYSEAKNILNDWIEKRILIFHEEEALYFYERTYEVYNVRRVLRGFFAIVRLEPFEKRIILPHEFTFSKPKEDRLNLLRATRSNISPVLGIYFNNDDNGIDIWKEVGAYKTIFDGDSFRFWALEGDIARSVMRSLADKVILIADGHHRYETALTYKEEMVKKYGRDGPYSYVMMFLVEANTGGLILLPTHRVIKNVPIDFQRRLEEVFSPEKDTQVHLGDNEHTVYYYRKGGLYRFTTEGLNVVSLHRFLDLFQNLTFYYTNSEKEAIALVDSGDYEMAFILTPVSMESIKSVVESGDRLPHKTTYFYPKVGAGFVIYKHNL
ncbi:MAG: DUF1015 family protein [bacterium]